MKGTALLIGQDRTVTALEDISHELYKDLLRQEGLIQIHSALNEKEVGFKSVSEIVWQEDKIDWAYGY